MREIRFRAFVIDDNMHRRMEYDVWPNGDDKVFTKDFFWMRYDSLMQDTGLRDKYGEKIYEGDIVRWGSHGLIGEVVYDESKGRYFWPSGPFNKFVFNKTALRSLVVIGNIYENSELLTPTGNGI